MPTKSPIILPFLDPQFNPDHPANNPPKIENDKYLPYGKRELKKMEKAALDEAIQSWTPPHVLRLYETDVERARTRSTILALHLSPRIPDFADLIPANKHDSSHSRALSTEDPTDFRNFAHTFLHLGFHRFHIYGTDPDEAESLSSDTQDSHDPSGVCWIAEYTEGECNIIRRTIAFAMGEFPSVLDPDSSLYDYEIAFRYERRLYCRCRQRDRKCVRPSHIEIFTSTGQLLP